jgi:acetyltransferase-like isoleucine patch superfamily enzyme
MNNLFSKLKFWSQTSFLKTLYFNYRFGVLKFKRIIIYPKSRILIDRDSHLNFGEGHLVINHSHFKKRFRNAYCILRVEKGGSLVLERDNFTLCEGSSVLVRKNAKILLKGKGFINSNSVIDCYSHIEIGHGTIISTNCNISDSDSHMVILKGIKKVNTKAIVIGDHVWIGKNVTILKGVKIGNNAIIAAGSIVTKDVPNNTLFGGNPAVIIREGVDWEF